MVKRKKFYVCSFFTIFLLLPLLSIHLKTSYADPSGNRQALPTLVAMDKKEQKMATHRDETNSQEDAKNKLKREKKKNEEQEIIEEAEKLIEAAQNYWEKGDMERAIEMLDLAYSLILTDSEEPEIARQKDDLRFMISKKILAIYSTKQNRANGIRSEIPLVLNEDVEREIESFLGRERDFFVAAYKRSFLFRPMILKELKKARLPEELSWLPLVESGFNVTALSPARALGLWQFIASTGYKYGLERDDWIDERLDPEKATKAAIAYLKELHEMFGDWLTALAAYNCGEGRVIRVISSQKINYFDRFWDLYRQLPYETARYVPRFLATLHIVKNPKQYGIDKELTETPVTTPTYTTVKTNKPMLLKDIANHLNISEEILYFLNPELRYKATPNREYNLKIPEESLEQFLLAADQIPSWEKPVSLSKKKRLVFVYHKVKKGETLSSVAAKYHTSVKLIKIHNKKTLKSKGVYAGQLLKVPVYSALYSPRHAKVAAVSHNETSYTVRKGDTLSSIATRFNTSVSELKRINNIKTDRVVAGQVLLVSSLDKVKTQNGKNNGKITRRKES
ncbi:MAG: LysM peptidoglycan-binding domain-containing protein [Syntrophales bacterium]|nr:LysM peptidoglycan-binding domain-containing protein [Syntrophales bacterium]